MQDHDCYAGLMRRPIVRSAVSNHFNFRDL